MTIDADLEIFLGVLAEATSGVPKGYFLLPIADTNGGAPFVQYRERVYAYELYHQLRLRWPGWQYSLGGEVDKRGHPLVRGPVLDQAKPDLLVHVAGKMEHNLVVLEIKAASPDLPTEGDAIRRDLLKLTAFRKIGYAAAILLVFGHSIDPICGAAREGQEQDVDLGVIELWHHTQPGIPAQMVPWDADPS